MQTVFVAVDIEKTGSFLIKNPIISVGFYAGNEKGEFLFKRKFTIKTTFPTITNEITDYGDFEPRCWNEFWSKLDKDIINKSTEDAKPAEEVWKNISLFLDELEEYPKVKFLTDNASFDIASIDYALEKYTGRAPMRYSSKGKYRSVISADDMLDMVYDKHKQAIDEYINKRAIHDHDPVNDAHHIYLQYIQAMHYKDL